MSEQKKVELNPSIAIIIAGILIAGAIIFTNSRAPVAAGQAAAAATGTLDSANIRPPSKNDHIVGSPNADIVLIEYSDFQCPYCTMIYPTLKKIVSESNGKIAWVYRHLPLTSIHPQAEPSANASECVAAQLGNDGFWKFAEAVINNQSQMNPTYYASLAQQLGANIDTYNRCMQDSTYQQVIDADATEAQGAGGTGTPFVVAINTKNGKAAPISGALPYAQIMTVIKSIE